MRVLITGISGFVGPYLAEHLVEHHPDVDVWGLVRWRSDLSRLEPVRSQIRLVTGDMTDGPSLVRALQAAAPDVILHLAASSTVGTSWGAPAHVMQVNVIGELNLFEAIRTLELEPIVVVAGSGEAYGKVEEQENPVTETQPFRPVSPYAVSKAAQDLLAYQYFASWGIRTVRLRPFNHTGPGRPDRFVASSFARQLAEIEMGLRPPRLKVGNLDIVRDFTDVREVARAYWLAALHCQAGQAYNVCSGRDVSIGQLLDALLRLSSCGVTVEVDPGRLRTADVPRLVGNHRLFTNTTGWEPMIPLETTLADLLNWWRERIAKRRS